MFSNISFIWRIYQGTCLRVMVILCYNVDWVLAVSTNSLRDYSFHTHDTPNTPYRSNNSTRVSYCWMFSLKEVLFRSVSRSICINHTLVNVVHSTLTCGATNKSYRPSVPICWFATTQLLVNQSISFILCWRLSFIHLRCSDRLTLALHFLFFHPFYSCYLIFHLLCRGFHIYSILPLTSEHTHTHPFR